MPPLSQALEAAHARRLRRYRLVLLALGLLLLPSLLLALGLGVYRITWQEWPQVLQGGEAYLVLTQIRLPRVLLAALVGGLWGLSGAVLQGLFRTPLADPALIGMGAGGALGAALWSFGMSGAWMLYGLPLAALAGTLLAVALVWRLAYREGQVQVTTLILVGVIFSTVAGALIGLLGLLGGEAQSRDFTFWTQGGFSGSNWALVGPLAGLGLLAGGLLLRLAPWLNALVLGEREARMLGLDVVRFKRRALWGVALAVGVAVAGGGVIAFVGLLAPQLFRWLAGPDHRYALPGALLLGALLGVWGDLLARLLAAPLEVPLSFLTALVGGPLFLWMLVQRVRL